MVVAHDLEHIYRVNNERYCLCMCMDCVYPEHVEGQPESTLCKCPECSCRGPLVPLNPAYFGEATEYTSKATPKATHGTCKTCSAPTYRAGTRGRFPVLCEAHK